MTYRLRLLGGFQLHDGEIPVELSLSAKRVVAYVGLHDRPVSRMSVSGNLWLDTSDQQALANLRSALWRLRRGGTDVIECSGDQLRVSPHVDVDFQDVTLQARTMLRAMPQTFDDAVTDVEAAAVLLPDWYDDWVLLERERFRQLRLHALESLCVELTKSRQFARAAEVGLVVVADEPLRESAHRVLMNVHLAEGNVGEALRQYSSYERFMRDDLGLGPSGQMLELLDKIRTTSRRGMRPDGDGPVTRHPDPTGTWRSLPTRSPTRSSEPGFLQSAKGR